MPRDNDTHESIWMTNPSWLFPASSQVFILRAAICHHLWPVPARAKSSGSACVCSVYRPLKGGRPVDQLGRGPASTPHMAMQGTRNKVWISRSYPSRIGFPDEYSKMPQIPMDWLKPLWRCCSRDCSTRGGTQCLADAFKSLPSAPHVRCTPKLHVAPPF